MRKETVVIDILIKSRKDERKIKQSIRIRSRPPSRIKNWNQQKNWATFDNEPKVQARKQVKKQQSYLSVFVFYVTFLKPFEISFPWAFQ